MYLGGKRSTLATDVIVTYDGMVSYSGPMIANESLGPRVLWRGPAGDAPTCTMVMPIDEVMFTVTATCTAVPGTSITQIFSLAQILA